MALDATGVVYTGVNLSYISVTSGMNLQTILGAINTAVNSMSPAPDYSGYSLACVTQTDGISHPTNTQNFAEGISLILCNLKTSYTTFTGTTYVADQAVITSAINALQHPAYTYVPFSITSADSITTVWSKCFTGFTAITNSINPASSNWSTIGASAQSTIVNAFNTVISKIATLTTDVTGLEPSIGTFDNSSNCLAGGATDDTRTTILAIIDYVCSTAPSFTPGSLTWGCVSLGTDLQSSFQHVLDSISSIQNNYVGGISGSGLLYATAGSCSGYTVAIDTSWTGYYKVMLSSGDTSSDADFLDNKIKSSDSSISFAISGNKLDLTVTNPSSNKVLVNSSDSSASYLINKIPSTAGTWGLGIISTARADNSQLILTPEIVDPLAFASTLMAYISSNPDLVAQWCAINTLCNGCTCTAPSGLTVAFTTGPNVFTMTWTPSGSASSQIAQYMERGSSTWISNVNFSSPNPLVYTATTVDVDNLSSNTVYQFQVLSNCSGVTNPTSVYEAIIFECQSLSYVVNGGIISANQDPLATVNTIQYQLLNNSNVVVDTQTATGLNPQVNFASQSAGTYKVNWRYGTTVNGVTVYSDAASQLNAWCQQTGITIS